MGGRGASSPGPAWLPPDVLEALPYNVTSFDDERGGAVFPFLEQTKRAWRILTKPVDEISKPHPAHTFGLDSPAPSASSGLALRWVNGSQVSDLYVDGMTTEQFLEDTVVKITLLK